MALENSPQEEYTKGPVYDAVEKAFMPYIEAAAHHFYTQAEEADEIISKIERELLPRIGELKELKRRDPIALLAVAREHKKVLENLNGAKAAKAENAKLAKSISELFQVKIMKDAGQICRQIVDNVKIALGGSASKGPIEAGTIDVETIFPDKKVRNQLVQTIQQGILRQFNEKPWAHRGKDKRKNVKEKGNRPQSPTGTRRLLSVGEREMLGRDADAKVDIPGESLTGKASRLAGEKYISQPDTTMHGADAPTAKPKRPLPKKSGARNFDNHGRGYPWQGDDHLEQNSDL